MTAVSQLWLAELSQIRVAWEDGQPKACCAMLRDIIMVARRSADELSHHLVSRQDLMRCSSLVDAAGSKPGYYDHSAQQVVNGPV